MEPESGPTLQLDAPTPGTTGPSHSPKMTCEKSHFEAVKHPCSPRVARVFDRHILWNRMVQDGTSRNRPRV